MLFAIILAAYLLGSIPFGLLLTKAAGLGDIRSIGSGNIGATNVLRTGKKSLAAATLLLDAAKGALAVLIARHFGGAAVFWAAIAVLVGHTYPIWLRFKGGKGVATGLGVLLAVSWVLGLIACAVWLVMAFSLKISSSAALAAFAAAPLVALGLHNDPLALLALLLAVLVYWKHRANIARLMAGTEPRIGKTI